MLNTNASNGPRIVLIGSTSVGKTSLINRITEKKFEPFTTPTTGTAFFQYHTKDPDHPQIQIWDTAGMERYRSLNRIFYHEAVGAILVFDLTNYRTFEELESWLNEFITEAPPNPSIVLVGNKCDLSDVIEVEQDEIQVFAKDHELRYFSTSAFSGEGVDDMLQALLSMIPKTTTVETTNLEEPEQSKCC
ncbi:putative Ras-related protein Rab-4A [Tritrichomonas foetus]|uniref:Ras-related protein Rab-4A n=1 Tax=Tritrichomonas foetus TaxID=1144522 RepID=A0A1J4K7E2_9EUKA|nr:putative Ras-related protein Rab-4A [Tritrichomonas foetus]|eukprot:OHT07295.1 putative Ras-related protein Rab-4A [Tritrichomonas foetus]